MNKYNLALFGYIIFCCLLLGFGIFSCSANNSNYTNTNQTCRNNCQINDNKIIQTIELPENEELVSVSWKKESNISDSDLYILTRSGNIITNPQIYKYTNYSTHETIIIRQH